MLNMKHFLNSLTLTSCSQFDVDAVVFKTINKSYKHFRKGLNDLTDAETSKQLLNNTGEQYDRYLKLMHGKELQFMQQLHQRSSSTDSEEEEPTSVDGTSHATNRTSNASKNSSLLKHIELERKKAKLQSLKDIAYIKVCKAKATAEAEARKSPG